MRGVSPIISTTLLVLIGVLVISVIYPWSNAIYAQISSSMMQDLETQTIKILSDVVVLLPPAELQGTPAVAVIQNTGKFPLTPFTVSVIDSNSVMYTDLNITIVDANGVAVTYTNGRADQLLPGETAVVELPSTSDNYYDWVVIVSSTHFIKEVRWV